MAGAPTVLEDIGRVLGGALGAAAGFRQQVDQALRQRVERVARRLDLVSRAELEAVQEIAVSARSGQEAAEARLAAVEARLAQASAPRRTSEKRAAQTPPDATSGTSKPAAAKGGGRRTRKVADASGSGGQSS